MSLQDNKKTAFQILTERCLIKDQSAVQNREAVHHMLAVLEVVLPAVRLAAEGGNVICKEAIREVIKLELQRCKNGRS